MVFVDETASNTALTRVYGRAPKGKRANGKIPRNKGKNVTVIASLSPSGMGESLILEDAANGEMFTLYLEKVLMPSLHPGQIVIMDNASIHEGEKVRQAIEAKGCHVLFLPTYSPDFSPIEEAGSTPLSGGCTKGPLAQSHNRLFMQRSTFWLFRTRTPSFLRNRQRRWCNFIR